MTTRPDVSVLDAVAAREFPRVRERDMPYLNTASTGPLPERALRAIHEQNEMRAEPWRFPPEVQFATLARSRELASQLIGASPSEIALTVNTTSGINVAARALPLRPGDVVIGTDRDFPANVYPWMGLARAKGVTFRQVPCAGRLFDEDALLAALDDPRVKALAISWVSFESGVRLDLDRLGEVCRARDIYFVVDAMQGLGALTLDVRTTPIDMLSCGGQKWLCAPWGAAFVYVRRELVLRLEPTFVGWMSVRNAEDLTRMLDYQLAYRDDARRFEVQTLPYQDFAGFNAALELFHEIGPAAIAARVQAHADRIVAWAQAHPGVELVTPADQARRAGIVAIVPPDPAGTSQRLTALGITHSLREGAIRLSPHFFTPVAHIERALDALERR